MGNKKNKKLLHSIRHSYYKKHIPQKTKIQRKRTPQKKSTSTTEKKRTTFPAQKDYDIQGSRIINLHRFQEYINELNTHCAQCDGSVSLSGEVRDGLASILSSCCSTCGHSITLKTSDKVKGPHGYQRWECNLAAVWGQMTTGGGCSQLEETMSIVGVPVMSKASFIQTERDIGEWWRTQLSESMIDAGKEEKRLAIERGEYHHDVPAVTVYVDGGWSKRSHKHSYNAKSGVAIIIGKATGKLLYLGVRNKYCS